MNMINVALSGATAAQTALNTTSQNIANVMTAGYTRQGVLLASVQPAQGGLNAAGNGVNTTSLLRFSDSYKNQQMWRANTDFGRNSVMQPYLDQLEQVMNDDNGSINVALDGFYSALNAASVDSTSTPMRQQVITAADQLAQRFNSMQQLLANQRTSIAQQSSASVQQINGLSSSIAELNRQIATAQSQGANASGLIDKRDQAIDSLANLVDIQIVDQGGGLQSVSLRGGQPLVVGTRAATMSVQTNGAGVQDFTLKFANETFALPASTLGGQLGGLNGFDVNTLQPLMQSVSDMANTIATKVNTQLAAGFGMSGAAGGPLFDFNAAGGAGVLSLHPGVLAQDLGFSGDATKPGDNSNLLAVIDIKNQPVALAGLGTVTLGDAFTQLVGNVASLSAQNKASLATSKTVRTQAEESWKSTSGVNQDEEAMNLLQYQQMYQANMKVIAVANQLFDSTLQIL
ncbi:flagellar hook-associated protein FlgK [Jeongeupia chitinilytica]|uniref:Flagellar hook-associated protein 1 n=1 Tax=Jeongeupia chitinilytica TaxID=1041641 RepID=A0ABQ3H0I3_9NEIS|nr:flagellar hook-associated protein FlgK [Jeongeupia chitinilytica]GHD63437.1 flagellar hook-associated protein 1 [Jeongeupia chitinilytica]